RLVDRGAVIFGYNVNFKWFWKDTGHPEEGEPLSPSEECEIQFHDSGIGSGLNSSAAEGSEAIASSSSQQPSSETTSGGTLTPEHYKVGVVCALQKELMA